MQVPSSFNSFIKTACQQQGLEVVGLAKLSEESDFPRFKRWLDQGAHGEMVFLEQYLEVRANPGFVFDGAKSAIVLAWNYYQGDKYSDVVRASKTKGPVVAQYARLRDYHKEIKKRAEIVAQAIKEAWQKQYPNFQVQYRVFTDSAPILERALAAKCGEGFIGKNTCYIHPQKGSFFLLGEIVTNMDLDVSDGYSSRDEERKVVSPHKRSDEGGCGTCKRCQVHCPTGALDKEYTLDARKCLSYWSIEHRGTIPEEYWPYFQWILFGCDICQLVCPYNRNAQITAEHTYKSLGRHADIFLVATMNQLTYEQEFGGSPITRAKREGLMRNALIAMCVRKDERLPLALQHIAAHESHPTLVGTIEQIAKRQQQSEK